MSNSQSFGAKTPITSEPESCEASVAFPSTSSPDSSHCPRQPISELDKEVLGQGKAQPQHLEAQLQAQISKVSQLTAQNHSLREQLSRQSALVKQLHQVEAAALQAEKMSTLGMLLAGVAHELNTPLGAIQASAGNLGASVTQISSALPQLCQHLDSEKQAALIQLLSWAATPSSRSSREERQLKRAIRAELQTFNVDNASSLAATLGAMGVAVEALEPLLPVLNSAHADLFLDVAQGLSAIQQNGENIGVAVERANGMVSSLRKYTRKSQTHPISTDLRSGIETVLTLYQNKLKYGIEVQAHYDDIPLLLCYPEELEQAWANLIGNAIQAMKGKGTLKLALTQAEGKIRVDITDSGPGISPENQGLIFTPYYTTKSREEGSGLGLAITQKIISRHRGSIEVDSSPGQTRFRVSLPADGLVNCEGDRALADSPFHFSLCKPSSIPDQDDALTSKVAVLSSPNPSPESPEPQTA